MNMYENCVGPGIFKQLVMLEQIAIVRKKSGRPTHTHCTHLSLHALVIVVILQPYDRVPGSKSVFVSCCNVQPTAPHDLRPNDGQTKFRVYD